MAVPCSHELIARIRKAYQSGNKIHIMINITNKENLSILRHGSVVAGCHVKYRGVCKHGGLMCVHVDVYTCMYLHAHA